MKYALLIACLFVFPLLAKEEKTLSILKPNAVKENHIGEIIACFESKGLRVSGLKMIQLSKTSAESFYQEHKGRPFFDGLVSFMTSGPVVVMVLQGDDAIKKNRDIMGSTDPKKAEKGTIRACFAQSITENAVHGSDSQTSAEREISFFFKPEELVQ